MFCYQLERTKATLADQNPFRSSPIPIDMTRATSEKLNLNKSSLFWHFFPMGKRAASGVVGNFLRSTPGWWSAVPSRWSWSPPLSPHRAQAPLAKASLQWRRIGKDWGRWCWRLCRGRIVARVVRGFAHFDTGVVFHTWGEKKKRYEKIIVYCAR